MNRIKVCVSGCIGIYVQIEYSNFDSLFKSVNVLHITVEMEVEDLQHQKIKPKQFPYDKV
jgi:hypothetical protein